MVIVDDRGIPLELDSAPRRIVSLVPSLTETLVDLGVEDRIVGLTKFCIRPDHLRRERKRIGGTKGINIGDVMDLQPDLVVANLEENEAQDVMALEIAGVPCWVSDVRSVERAFSLIAELGLILGRAEEGKALSEEIRSAWIAARADFRPGADRVAYAVWRNPWMWAGSDAYIQDVLRWWGWHPWPDIPRYPTFEVEALTREGIDEVFLPSEPFPFKEAHRAECAGIPSRLVDGEMFSWYGSRMRHVPAYLESWTGTMEH